MKIFKNRQSAGQLLTKRLKGMKADLVLGIPRGGVVVAGEIAKKLKLPLDIIVTRKIGAPFQEELALGAVDPDGEVVWEEELLRQVTPSELKPQIEKAWKEIKRREDLYRQGKYPLDVKGKTVILADDGMATGATVFAACRYLKRHKANIILAVPVVSKEALKKVQGEVEQVVVIEIPEYFQAVGQFYHQFEPVSDDEVVEWMEDER